VIAGKYDVTYRYSVGEDDHEDGLIYVEPDRWDYMKLTAMMSDKYCCCDTGTPDQSIGFSGDIPQFDVAPTSKPSHAPRPSLKLHSSK